MDLQDSCRNKKIYENEQGKTHLLKNILPLPTRLSSFWRWGQRIYTPALPKALFLVSLPSSEAGSHVKEGALALEEGVSQGLTLLWYLKIKSLTGCIQICTLHMYCIAKVDHFD